jgi:hypothetical protein
LVRGGSNEIEKSRTTETPPDTQFGREEGRLVGVPKNEDAVMNGVIWLRISAIVSLLFAAAHTLGGRSSWSPVGQNEVLVSMRTVHFHFQGLSRSFLDFYRGFGYSLGVFLVLQGIV